MTKWISLVACVLLTGCVFPSHLEQHAEATALQLNELADDLRAIDLDNQERAAKLEQTATDLKADTAALNEKVLADNQDLFSAMVDAVNGNPTELIALLAVLFGGGWAAKKKIAKDINKERDTRRELRGEKV